MQLVVVLILATIDISTGCEIPQNVQISTVAAATTTTAKLTTTKAIPTVNLCDRCDYNVMLKQVDVPDFVLPSDFGLDNVNGCLVLDFACKEQNSRVCDIKAYVTNSDMNTTVKIGEEHFNVLSHANITCGASGFYENDGVKIDGLYCTMSNCV